MRKLYFTVTNDLNYDQRMIRICSSLATRGYEIHLVGVKHRISLPLTNQTFIQHRLPVLFGKGKLFYAEFNLRLFIFLLFRKMDALCSIDLDTILPGYFISAIKGIPRIYDAHELFCEMKEVVTRPAIYRLWKKIEKFTVPQFKYGYTVNQPIMEEFQKMYGVDYEVISSITVLRLLPMVAKQTQYILYQGAVNEGRAFETLIPAMKQVDCRLLICGDGNFMQQAKDLVKQNGLEDKIEFKGKIPPEQLRDFTYGATIGLTLFENNGLSNYLSLANRFFDYMHALVPQLCVDYPAYREINDQVEVACLINNPGEEEIAAGLNRLLSDPEYYSRLKENCGRARELFNWQNEEKKLFAFYERVFANEVTNASGKSSQ